MNLKGISEKRRTVKEYDASKKISDDELKQILDFVYQSPTSMNWQTSKVVVIKRDSETFKKFGETTNSFNWAKVKDAQATLYFISPKKELLEDYAIKRGTKVIQDTQNKVATKEEAIKSQEFAMSFISDWIEGGFNAWAARQTYIAMSYATIAAANLGIDSTIQEGVVADEIKKVLVEEKMMLEGEQVILALSIGHRSDSKTAVLPTYRDAYEEKIIIAK
ncbi:MAG: nitroreductase family protein [Mycoplasmataceae bacterium]|nr:nitroreductase family protein [Mycoplasmataceae bacterium]